MVRKGDIVIKNPLNSTTEIKYTFKQAIYVFAQKFLSHLYLHKILKAIFIISLISFIISFIWPWFGLRKIRLPEITKENISVPNGNSKVFKRKPLSFYIEGIKAQQVFSSPALQETEVSATKTDSTELMKDINLVGIISGENLQAVIEDKKNQKTYYVSKGQFIGEFRLEDIQEGKVILNYRGQKFELYL